MTIEIREAKSGHKYFVEDGKRLPSPSTVCSRFKESGALMYWANQQGLEGIPLNEAQKAATTPGSIVHERIECDIRGHDFDYEKWQAKVMSEGLDVDEVLEKVNASWQMYLDWRAMTNLQPISAEVSLVSEKHKFGGTLDCVAVSSGLYLTDWKTGSIYPDHVLQLGGGYTVLWEENFPNRPLDGVMLLSISKEETGFTQKVIPRKALGVVIDQFLRLLEAYKVDKQIKKLAA